MVKRSCKGSKCIGYLERKLDEIDFNPDTSRNGRFNRAVVIARQHTIEELKAYAKELKSFKAKIPSEEPYPTALQTTVDDNLEGALEEVEKNLMAALELSKLQARYEFEFLFFLLYRAITREVIEVGKAKDNAIAEDLTGPEMVKRLVEVLLLSREEDKAVIEEVKAALLKWEV